MGKYGMGKQYLMVLALICFSLLVSCTPGGVAPSTAVSLAQQPSESSPPVSTPSASSALISAEYIRQGDAFLQADRFDEALVAYDKAIEADPDRAEAYFGRGNALRNSGVYEREEALKAYDRAITIKPDYTEAYFEKGNILFLEGLTKEAVAAYDKAIELKPDYPEAYYGKGCALEVSGSGKVMSSSLSTSVQVQEGYKMLRGAVEALDRAIELKPDYAHAFFIKGVSLYQLQRYEDAILSLNRAIEMGILLDLYIENAYIVKARALVRQSKPDEALKTLDAGLEAVFRDGSKWYDDGDGLYFEKAVIYSEHYSDAKNAVENLEKCLEINPGRWKFIRNEQKFENISSDAEFQKLIG